MYMPCIIPFEDFTFDSPLWHEYTLCTNNICAIFLYKIFVSELACEEGIWGIYLGGKEHFPSSLVLLLSFSYSYANQLALYFYLFISCMVVFLLDLMGRSLSHLYHVYFLIPTTRSLFIHFGWVVLLFFFRSKGFFALHEKMNWISWNCFMERGKLE